MMKQIVLIAIGSMSLVTGCATNPTPESASTLASVNAEAVLLLTPRIMPGVRTSEDDFAWAEWVGDPVLVTAEQYKLQSLKEPAYATIYCTSLEQNGALSGCRVQNKSSSLPDIDRIAASLVQRLRVVPSLVQRFVGDGRELTVNVRFSIDGMKLGEHDCRLAGCTAIPFPPPF